METEQDYSETLSQILQELQALNANLSEYTTYVKDRNTAEDEAAAQKEQEETQEEQTQQEETIPDTEENTELTVTTVDKLTDIHTTLEDFETVYKELSSTAQATDENIEFNSNMNFLINAVGLGLLAILIGLLFGRMVFRKL